MGLTGLTAALISTGISLVQPSVRKQVAYAFVAQLGLVLIEMAAGLQVLAMVHLTGNALLRIYQLDALPHTLGSLASEHRKKWADAAYKPNSFQKKLFFTLYILCMKKWNLMATRITAR